MRALSCMLLGQGFNYPPFLRSGDVVGTSRMQHGDDDDDDGEDDD